MDIKDWYSKRVSASPHAAKVERTDRGYRCLCCRDNALIPQRIVLKYLDDEEYRMIGPSATPFLCERNGCDANRIWVDKPETGGQVKVDRYNTDGLRTVGAAYCQVIHESELAEISLLASEPPMQRIHELKPAIETIGRKMPDLSAAEKAEMDFVFGSSKEEEF